MQIAEVFERAEITSDSKARRVANVAPDQTANITADELESGVTIERLETIGVPILKYSQQITIHGKLPAFDPLARPGGYKAVFQNQNGSIGVRYVALDAEKKRQIVDASNYHKRDCWYAHINSKGLEIVGYWHEKEPCLAAFKAFPRELFAGSICAFSGMFGGYYVEVAIGVIYEKDLWALIAHCFGFSCPADLQAAKEVREREYEAIRAKYKQEQAEREAKEAAQVQDLASKIGLTPLRTLPKGECAFVRVVNSWSEGAKAKLYVVKKRGFGQICYATRPWERGLTTFEPMRKMKRFDDYMRSTVQKECEQGLVFQPA